MRVIDCFAEVFGYVEKFRQTVDTQQPEYESVRDEIINLLKQSETFHGQKSIPFDDYNDARYAVCAWIDESVLSTTWAHRNRWRPELLQRVYYNATDAGQKFFEKLNHLGPDKKGVREVYFMCLALGFKGRYCDPDDAYALNELKNHQIKLIFNGAKEAPTLTSFEKTALFPGAYPESRHVQHAARQGQKQDRVFWLSVLGGPAAFLFLLLLIYRFTLGSVGENILRAISQ